MGHLIIDHRNGQGIDGKKGTLQEFDTLPCRHCGRIIARMYRVAGNPSATHHLANIDIGRAAPMIQHLGGSYDTQPRCHRCGPKAYICRLCAGVMEQAGGECPGPWEARNEIAAKTGVPAELCGHRYGQMVTSGIS